MKAGTLIELHGTPAIGGMPAVAPERAVIVRSNTNAAMPGWHAVRFADGGKLLIHESRFRIIDNR